MIHAPSRNQIQSCGKTRQEEKAGEEKRKVLEKKEEETVGMEMTR